MIFDLVCLNDKNVEVIWKYNSITNQFLDENGNLKFDKKNKNFIKIYPFDISDNPYKFSNSSIRNINIVFGNKCNFECPYCVLKFNFLNKKFKIENIRNVLKKIKEFENLENIFFIAGETLIYWKQISKIIEILRNEVNFKKNIKILTNGTLLDKEKCDFLIMNNIKLLISYDGKNSERKYDLFEDENFIELIKYVLSKNKIKIVFNYLRTIKSKEKFLDVKKRIESIFGESYFYRVTQQRIPLRFVHKNFKKEIDLIKSYLPSKNQKEEMINEFFESIEEDINLKERIFEKIKKIKSGGGFDYSGCGIAIGKNLVIDTNGDVYSCLNDYEKIIGNINCLSKIKLNGYIHPLRRKKCVKCPFINLCSGSSYKMDENDLLFDINCIFLKIQSESILKYICKKLFNLTLKEIRK